MNLWDCGSEKNSSHFTAVRILKYLLVHRAEASKEGQGYVDIARMSGLFEEVFDAREDFIRTLERLVSRQLVETNTRSTEGVLGASHVRATSAGWYFSRHLRQRFPYLDLVLQDTPIASSSVERSLRDLVEQVDNLGDREEQKIERLGIRFRRVKTFLEYLEDEERAEAKRYSLSGRIDILSERIVKPMADALEEEREWILTRVRENRERYADEPQIDDVEDKQFIGDRLAADDDVEG
ncbi:MAG TPA: hypothetical protein VF516_07880 [Kofleriaceae bacterium]